jgi:FkbM family methyltransferase
VERKFAALTFCVPSLAEVAVITDRIEGPLASFRARLGRAVPRRRIQLVGPKLLAKFAEAYPSATFVEIGAHDGTSSDYLRPHVLARSWTGVMVEPVPHLFERLRRSYGALERVALENAAISDREGRVALYHLPPVDDPESEGLPSWYDLIGSLSRENIVGHRDSIPDIERLLVRTDVRCMTFESLCRKHDLRELDVLVVDTEGHDWTILRGVDFDAHRPQLVIYEHLHLAPSDRVACRTHLEQLGYEIREEGFDTWCLHRRASRRVRRTWRRLRWRVPAMSAHDR